MKVSRRIKKKKQLKTVAKMELMTGLEPVTSALPRQCATDCATSAYFVLWISCVSEKVFAVVVCFTYLVILYELGDIVKYYFVEILRL